MSHAQTPLVIFAYRRPEHLQRCLAALERCAGLDQCAVRIDCDGPRPGEAQGPVEAVREVAREWAARHGAEVVASPVNRGLARSIVEGVSGLCATAGRVIVLEDDLEVAPDFLRYMLAALERYAADETVLQVSGHRLPFPWPGESDTGFLPCTTTWGWATWQRAWTHFRSPPADVAALEDAAVATAFDLGGSYPYAQMLRQRLSGENDSWGILWWWAVFRARGLVLYPRESLVHVGGFDGTGTHCEPDSSFLPDQQRGSFSPERHRFPEAIRVDEAALAGLQRWLRAKTQPSWWKRTWQALIPA